MMEWRSGRSYRLQYGRCSVMNLVAQDIPGTKMQITLHPQHHKIRGLWEDSCCLHQFAESCCVPKTVFGAGASRLGHDLQSPALPQSENSQALRGAISIDCDEPICSEASVPGIRKSCEGPASKRLLVARKGIPIQRLAISSVDEVKRLLISSVASRGSRMLRALFKGNHG